jgi:plasmid stability protein
VLDADQYMHMVRLTHGHFRILVIKMTNRQDRENEPKNNPVRKRPTGVQVRIPDGLLAALDEHAARHGRSRHGEILALIEERITGEDYLIASALGALLKLLALRLNQTIDVRTGDSLRQQTKRLFFKQLKFAIGEVLDLLSGMRDEDTQEMRTLGQAVGRKLWADMTWACGTADEKRTAEQAALATAWLGLTGELKKEI